MINTVKIPQFVINDMKIRNNMAKTEKLIAQTELEIKCQKLKLKKLLFKAMRFAGLMIIILMVIQNLKG